MPRRLFAWLSAACVWLAIAAPAVAGNVRQVDPYWPASSPGSGCWTVKVTGSPPASLHVLRQGFDTNGKPALLTEDVALTVPVGQPWPVPGTSIRNATDRYALAGFLFATDKIPGVKNLCKTLSPKPVAGFWTHSGLVYGNTLSGAEVVAGHWAARNNSEVAAVVCRATDGTNTVSGVVSTPTISTHETAAPFQEVYLCPSLDITSLNAGFAHLEADVIPWVGGNGSILHSADIAFPASFSSRTFWKDTGNPLAAFLCPQSNCRGAGTASTSCVASTTLATAEASPCSTGLAAANALKASGVALHNAVVYIGTNAGTPPALASSTSAAMTQDGGCLTFTRDTTATRAQAQLTFGNSDGPEIDTVTNETTSCLRFFDMSPKRTACNTLTASTIFRERIYWDSVNIDEGACTGTWFHSSFSADDYLDGVAFSNIGSGFLAPSSNGSHRFIRGVTGLSTAGAIEAVALGGNIFTNSDGTKPPNSQVQDGLILYGNIFDGLTTGQQIFSIDNPIPTGIFVAENVCVFTSTQTGLCYGFSPDADTNSTYNVLAHGNTAAGAWNAGRDNDGYNDGATYRLHAMWNYRGQLLASLNSKGDWFRGANELAADAPARTGNWGFSWGAGVQSTVTAYIDANQGGVGSNFTQAYAGLGASMGLSNTTPSYAFTTPHQVTYNGTTYSAGSTGGNYVPVHASLACSRVTQPMFTYDINGALRGTATTASGAYECP